MNDFIVIGHDTRHRRDFEVHRRKGDTVKDVQDRTARTAEKFPHVIYTVVPVVLHRRFHPKSMLAALAGQRD